MHFYNQDSGCQQDVPWNHIPREKLWQKYSVHSFFQKKQYNLQSDSLYWIRFYFQVKLQEYRAEEKRDM